MTDPKSRFTPPVAAIVLLVALGGCDSGHGTDYCKNHYVFHTDHVESVGALDIGVAEEGVFEARLMVPAPALGGLHAEPARAMLDNAGSVLSLQTAEAACEVSVADVSMSGTGFTVALNANCGSGNKLEQIDVLLFDKLPELEEVVVSVTTPATAKHFGINRACERPIFRLE